MGSPTLWILVTGRGRLTTALAATLLAACAASAEPADAGLCSEVERVVHELGALDPPIVDADRPTQEHRILASHLLVALDGSGRDEEPDPALAAAVRDTGWLGTSGRSRGADIVAALEETYTACEDAGVGMDRDALTALADEG